MKKLWLGIFSMMILLGAAACGAGEDTTVPDVTTEAPEVTTPPEEEVTIEGWYLQEPPLFPDYYLNKSENTDCTVSLPLTYSKTVAEFDFAFESFREAWPWESFLQMRVRVVNHGDTDFVYRLDTKEICYFKRSDGCIQEFDEVALGSVLKAFARPGVVGYNRLVKDRVPARGEEPEYFERVFYVDPAFFVPDGGYTYTFYFTLQEIVEISEVETREPRVITVEIPVTVEKIED